MRMERQPREGEVLPNERARILRPYSVINVELYDDAHITLWIRGAALTSSCVCVIVVVLASPKHVLTIWSHCRHGTRREAALLR